MQKNIFSFRKNSKLPQVPNSGHKSLIFINMPIIALKKLIFSRNITNIFSNKISFTTLVFGCQGTCKHDPWPPVKCARVQFDTNLK